MNVITNDEREKIQARANEIAWERRLLIDRDALHPIVTKLVEEFSISIDRARNHATHSLMQRRRHLKEIRDEQAAKARPWLHNKPQEEQ